MKIRNLVIATIMLAGFAVSASAQDEVDYNWEGAFLIGPAHNHVVTHTPSRVCIDNMICSGRSIKIIGGFNDLKVSACGLYVKTESTKAEFVAALKCAGLNPIEA